MYIYLYGFILYIFQIFRMIIEKCTYTYEVDQEVILDIFKNMLKNIIEINEEGNEEETEDLLKEKVKVGLLTNEIPPVVYGGVATWIVNYLEMFKDDNEVEVIPIFLAYNDELPKSCEKKYPNIRIINQSEDLKEVFRDIDICVNNLWIALETIHQVKELFPELDIITVCHSLIRMENITNLGSCYTNNFNQQEMTFKDSDHIVLISKAEERYYNTFGYDKLNSNTNVIYNSYTPKYDDAQLENNYTSNDIGYIGRHVPRKRPEIPILAVNGLDTTDVKVINMGVDYDKYDNEYWREMEKKYKDTLVIIPFSSDSRIKEDYWKTIGINCITGIYEPFGYTICESIDRRVPLIVSNIDGPKEIIEEVKEYIYTYEVDIDNYGNDIKNFSSALLKMWETNPKERKLNCENARKCLDKLRPEVIKKEWKKLFYERMNQK